MNFLHQGFKAFDSYHLTDRQTYIKTTKLNEKQQVKDNSAFTLAMTIPVV